ncbi:MAG: class I SAM-dependent methyltransferase [Planctomycetota bacterium]
MPQKRDCPICQSGDHYALGFRGRSRLPLQPVVCRGCGLVFINPMYPDVEKEAGTEGARAVHRPVRYHQSLAAAQQRQVPAAERVIGVLKDRIRTGDRVLDIGCGDGALLRGLKQIGAAPTGCDLDPYGAIFIQQNFGIPVVVAPFEQAGFQEGSFEAVVATHVIEHFFDPVAALRKMRSLLSSNGILLLETPNLLRPKVGPRRLFSVPHNYYFTPRTLCLALHKAGFRPAAVREFHRDSFLVLAYPAEAGEADCPMGDDWRQVARAIRGHAIRYRASLQFLWRKIPGIKSAWMYRVHRDTAGEDLRRWLKRAA